MKHKALELRKKIFNLCCHHGSGHLTSALSCVEILMTLFYDILNYDSTLPDWSERDYFILSKGHAAPTLYTILADCGFFPEEELWKDYKYSTHPSHDVQGVEFSTGSLGHGLSYAVGLALGLKLSRKSNLVFVLVGDGECYEGIVWEAINFAGGYNLNNLIVIVDRNGLCATDFTEDILPLSNLSDRFSAFGWNTKVIDGHDQRQLYGSLKDVRSKLINKPLCIIAHTIKGKGIKSIENEPLWHARCPSLEQKEQLEMEFSIHK